MHVAPEAIPALRKVFTDALTKLDRQIELAITDLRVRPWAGDPVSANAADEFNNRTMTDGDSALEALRQYQERLQSAHNALNVVQTQYELTEGHNTKLVTGKDSGC
jgi:hypothetical protein